MRESAGLPFPCCFETTDIDGIEVTRGGAWQALSEPPQFCKGQNSVMYCVLNLTAFELQPMLRVLNTGRWTTCFWATYQLAMQRESR